MKHRPSTLLYWSITLFFAFFMLVDGVAGVLRLAAGQEVMRHLGFPLYVLSIFGVAKILGALALGQPRFRALKEWAYAGFASNFLGAAASRAFVGDSITLIIIPLAALCFMLLSYYLWKVNRSAKVG